MKNIIVLFASLLLGSSVCGQWKAQTAETYDNTYRIAYVTSTGGTETLRILRNMTTPAGEKGATPYDDLTGQIMLNKNIGDLNSVESIVFRFDESTRIYILQTGNIKQQWDANIRKYMIESGWQTWRIGDTRDKSVRKAVTDPASIPPSERTNAKGIIDLLKASQKVSCQIVLYNSVHETQSIINCEFTLQNSTKSINYLFK
jgi:hypothetical protein